MTRQSGFFGTEILGLTFSRKVLRPGQRESSTGIECADRSPKEKIMNSSSRMTLVLPFAGVLLVLSCVIPPVAQAQVPADIAARTVQYAATDIIPIRAKVRFSTLIVLPADEEILDATTGDKEFWIINGDHNLCYLHPAQHGIRTNLNLITASGHVYSFLLTEISKDPKAEPDLKVFVERKEGSAFPGADSVAPLARASEVQAYKTAVDAARVEASQQVHAALEKAHQEINQYREQYAGKLQFDYSYDSKASRPPFSVSAIYYDDKFTYIKSSAQEKPTVYELKDGKPNLINFDLDTDVYVIPKILDSGYLVLGKKS
jgi:type IV secretion system protein VirB9